MLDVLLEVIVRDGQTGTEIPFPEKTDGEFDGMVSTIISSSLDGFEYGDDFREGNLIAVTVDSKGNEQKVQEALVDTFGLLGSDTWREGSYSTVLPNGQGVELDLELRRIESDNLPPVSPERPITWASLSSCH